MHTCCRPGCSNAATKSCTRCKIANYCGRDCQRAHWKVHKKSCGKQKSAKQIEADMCVHESKYELIPVVVERKYQPPQVSLSMIKAFFPDAMAAYDFPDSPYCERVYKELNELGPFAVTAFLIISGSWKSGNAKDDRLHAATAVCCSPVVASLEAIFSGFPFDMALASDRKTRGTRFKGEIGFQIREYSSRLVQALYEAFYRGLIGPITSPRHFVPDVLARPSISGRPVFVIGLPRTGTSILQYLLSLDTENNRSPKNWEYHTPSSSLSDDERIKYISDFLGGSEDHGRWREMQPQHPAEDSDLFMGAGGVGFNPEDNESQDWTKWNSYRRDHIALMCMHRLIIRQLEVQKSGELCNAPKQWIFKDPAHLGHHLEAIVKVYPDARFVWMHRNLTDCVNSFFRMGYKKEDDIVARGIVANLLSDLRQGMSFRQTGRYLEDGDFGSDTKHKCYNVVSGSQEHRFSDIFLEDLIEDPVRELEKLYADWDMEMSDTYRTAIQEWNSGKEKRNPISSDSNTAPGFGDMNEIGLMMRRNREYFKRFLRACPKRIVIVDRDENGNELGLLGNLSGM